MELTNANPKENGEIVQKSAIYGKPSQISSDKNGIISSLTLNSIWSKQWWSIQMQHAGNSNMVKIQYLNISRNNGNTENVGF